MLGSLSSESLNSLKGLFGVHVCTFLFQFIFIALFGLENFIFKPKGMLFLVENMFYLKG